MNGTTTPTRRVWPLDNRRASALGWKSSSAMTWSTPAVAVWEIDGDGLRSSAMSGWEPVVVRDRTSLPLAGAMPVADAARGRRTVLLEDGDGWARDYPHLQDVVAASGYRGLAAWPLVVAGQCLGAVAAGFPGPRTLGAEERATAAVLVEQCAQAVIRARLLQALEQ